MTTALTAAQRAMPVATMHDAAQLAQCFAQAHVMGAKNDAEGMLVVTLIREIGLVKAESTYHIMQGRISKKASAVCADFIKAGGSYKILKRDAEGARLTATYKDNVDVEMRFLWEDALEEPFIYAGGEDAQFAELKKPVEERKLRAKYRTPRSRTQMLWARLVSDMVTTLCPEARDGMYTPEEVSDFTPEHGDDVQPAPIDVTEAARRMEDAEGVIDYTVCPIEGKVKGMSWSQFTVEQLKRALESDDEAITNTHRAAICYAITEKEGE